MAACMHAEHVLLKSQLVGYSAMQCNAMHTVASALMPARFTLRSQGSVSTESDCI